MKFSRKLSRKFIDALNSIYNSEESWWRKIADDDDVFILIRNNELRVQANGGLLLQIKQDGNNNLICKMHEEYLSLRSEKDPYVNLDENSTAPIQRVEGLKGFVKHYDSIKRRISIFTGKEKQSVQYLANKILNIVDVEVGYEGDMKGGAQKKSAPRVDLAAITAKGTLIFFEVKLFDNNEIRSAKTPKVVSQLQKYRKWMAQNDKDIIESYREQFNVYEQFKGKFFKKRAKIYKSINLYPNVRLIITGFDASQRGSMLSSIRSGIENGMGWKNNNDDLITIGNHKGLAKSNRLFLGVK